MKYKVGDKIKYRDFLVERNPELAGAFTVDRTEESSHPGFNLISAPQMPKGRMPDDACVCSADFEPAE